MNQGHTTALLTMAKSGDRESFNILCSRIIPRLLIYIRAFLGPEHGLECEAEDIAQDVLIKAHLKLSTFEKESSRSFFAWLTSITRNTIKDQWIFWSRASRDRSKTQYEYPELASYYHSALSKMIIDEDRNCLNNALLSLPEHYRIIIIKRQFEELSFAEISSELGKAVDAVRMLHARAMVRLTKEMARERQG